MRLYLDNSALNRPFDDQSQARVWLESLSLGFVWSLIEFGEAELLRSPMHDLENLKTRDVFRRGAVEHWLDVADNPYPTLGFSGFSRAVDIQALGVKEADAYHLAYAKQLNADYFLTCDDRIIKILVNCACSHRRRLSRHCHETDCSIRFRNNRRGDRCSHQEYAPFEIRARDGRAQAGIRRLRQNA
jgi:hypothetical protein